MCVFVVLLFFGPRSAIVLWWLFDSLRFDVTFSSFWVPFVGFLLAPWTTLMYVVVAPGGVNGFDWVWLGLASCSTWPATARAASTRRRGAASPAGLISVDLGVRRLGAAGDRCGHDSPRRRLETAAVDHLRTQRHGVFG